jgi:hypothetical protein
MNKEEFIDRTLTCLFEETMPPGMERAKLRIQERFDVPSDSLNRLAWEMYDYSDKDRTQVVQKLRTAAGKVVSEAMQKNTVEFGLLAPEAEDYEIERVFRAHDEEGALHRAIEWAEEEGYEVEEPTGDAESIFDWRFDGRRLTQID